MHLSFRYFHHITYPFHEIFRMPHIHPKSLDNISIFYQPFRQHPPKSLGMTFTVFPSDNFTYHCYRGYDIPHPRQFVAIRGFLPSEVAVRRPRLSGFTLIELAIVLGIAGILLTLGIAARGHPAHTARKAAIDVIAAAVDEARTAAITLRRPVLLAISEPASAAEGPVKLGLFRIGNLPSTQTPLGAFPLGRWRPLPEGVAFRRGNAGGLRNLMDGEAIELISKGISGTRKVHALAFTPRGSLAWPEGSDPLSLEIGSGTYQDDRPLFRSAEGTCTLRIGRVVARPWKLD